jgi:transmembrane sensor
VNDKNVPVTPMNHGPYPEPGIPVEEAWGQMKQWLDAAPRTTPAARPAFALRKKLIGYGCAGLAAVMVMVYIFVFNKPSQHSSMNIYASNDSPGKQILPGGTLVFLDRNSRIREETGADSKVTLSVNGAAYIENAPEKEQVLQVQTGSLTILPRHAGLYVSFDSSTMTAAVHVLSGNAVIKAGKDTFMLWAGESVCYDGRLKHLGKKLKADVNIAGYATRNFDFVDTPLAEAVACIEKAYAIKITIAGHKQADCRITARFDHKTLKEVLDIIAYTLQLDYSIDEKNNNVLLDGKGCN